MCLGSLELVLTESVCVRAKSSIKDYKEVEEGGRTCCCEQALNGVGSRGVSRIVTFMAEISVAVRIATEGYSAYLLTLSH